MSATNHTANLNLPIYQPNDVLNYTLDWNGAMQTLDTSVTANKTLGDRLETEFDNIETDFQTVSAKADSAATTAAAANSAATNAVTIANNASTMAGDAKTDAHAALTLLEKMTTSKYVQARQTIGTEPTQFMSFLVQTASTIGYRLAFYSMVNTLQTSLENNFEIYAVTPTWNVSSSKTPFSSQEPFSNNEHIDALPINSFWSYGDVYGMGANKTDAIWGPYRMALGILKRNDGKWYPAFNTQYLPYYYKETGSKAYFQTDTTFFNFPLIKPISLLSRETHILEKNVIYVPLDT